MKEVETIYILVATFSFYQLEAIKNALAEIKTYYGLLGIKNIRFCIIREKYDTPKN